ncbi:hypothetical protein M0R45_006672 [Rubus argutus]|uniref:Bifunctional inhibitor/plant lipid transfer protein/seed storage helical domain-containing protein n=1 Tax=Rubus argutus TaxID=59490 RepID=A0AAW1YR89_RUBAR
MKLSNMMLAAVVLVFFLTSDLAVVAGGRPAAEEAVTCNPLELSSCLDPIRYGSRPSSTCCQKLKEQIPCFCGYLKNPVLRGYVSGPNARKLSSNCGVPYPRC